MSDQKSSNQRLGRKEKDVVESEGKDGGMESPHWSKEGGEGSISSAPKCLQEESDCLHLLFARPKVRIGRVYSPVWIIIPFPTTIARPKVIAFLINFQ
jgi:hypothetical protein